MSRGDYSSGREISGLAGWGARHVALGAAARVAEPALAAVSLADRGYRAAQASRDVYTAARVLHQTRGVPPAVIGQEWWHGAEDRSLAIARVGEALTALVHDLMAELHARRDALHAHPDPAALRALEADIAWVTAEVQPAITQWTAFAQKQAASTWTLIATDWQAFEDWLDKVKLLRQLARARGFHLTSPDPADLPKTIWQRGAAGEGGAASWLGLLKIAMAGLLGLAGVAGLYGALRKPREPRRVARW